LKIGIIYRDRTKYANSINPHDSEGRDENPEVFAIANALSKIDCDIELVDIGDHPHEKLKNFSCDLAINLCDEGLRGSSSLEPHIPIIFDMLNIHHTGADYKCISTCNNKIRTKEILSYHKVKTPRFQAFQTGLEKLSAKLEFPLIVKPSKEDGSIGIRQDSVVHNEDALFKKIEEVIKTYKQSALVEEYIEGREITVGIIGNKHKIILPPMETVFENYPENSAKIYSYEAKWLEDTPFCKNLKYVSPPEMQKTVETKMKRIALKVFNLLGCTDYARVDFRINSSGELYVLEANPNPCLQPEDFLHCMGRSVGLSYDQIIYAIVKSAFERAGLKKLEDIHIELKPVRRIEVRP